MIFVEDQLPQETKDWIVRMMTQSKINPTAAFFVRDLCILPETLGYSEIVMDEIHYLNNNNFLMSKDEMKKTFLDGKNYFADGYSAEDLKKNKFFPIIFSVILHA